MCAYSLESDIDTYPDDWNPTKIGEIAEVRGGYSFPVNYQGNIQGDIPFYKVSDMNLRGNETRMSTANNYVTLEMLAHLNGKTFPENTIIFPKVGGAVYTNKKRILTSNSLVDNNIMGVVVSETNRCYSEFLYYWFVNTDLKNFSNPGPLPSITATAIKNAFVPLPPIHEQRAIAHVLTTVRQSIEATERVIAAARELKRSMMKHLFTYGAVSIDQIGNVPLKETEIGFLPENWNVKRLEEAIEKPQYGYTESASEKPIGPNFLRITDIMEGGQVNWSSVPFCKCSNSDYEKYRLQPGDILVARIGATTGKSFLVEDSPPCVFASYLIRVRTNSAKLQPQFLHYFMNSNVYWNQINATKGGRLKQGVNIPNLQDLRIPLPDLYEQEKICNILNAIDKKIQVETKHLEALQICFRSLLHNLVTGNIRIHVDKQN